MARRGVSPRCQSKVEYEPVALFVRQVVDLSAVRVDVIENSRGPVKGSYRRAGRIDDGGGCERCAQ